MEDVSPPDVPPPDAPEVTANPGERLHEDMTLTQALHALMNAMNAKNVAATCGPEPPAATTPTDGDMEHIAGLQGVPPPDAPEMTGPPNNRLTSDMSLSQAPAPVIDGAAPETPHSPVPPSEASDGGRDVLCLSDTDADDASPHAHRDRDAPAPPTPTRFTLHRVPGVGDCLCHALCASYDVICPTTGLPFTANVLRGEVVAFATANPTL